MRIRFLRPYRGVLTGEMFYEVGEVADLPSAPAIVGLGAAEYVATELGPPTADPALLASLLNADDTLADVPAGDLAAELAAGGTPLDPTPAAAPALTPPEPPAVPRRERGRKAGA